MKIHSDQRGAHIRLTRVEKDRLRGLSKGLTPRTGHRRKALEKMVANHCPSPEQKAQDVVGWFDEVIEAAHWFALNDISPADAAMLLCQHNPNEEMLAAAEQSTNDETGPRELVQLRQRFEDFSRTDPRTRSLVEWLRIARELELRHHSWAQQYIDAAARSVPSAESTSAAAADAGAAGRVADTGPVTSAAADIEEGEWAVQAADEVLNWKARAQAQACIIWRQWRRRGGNPTPHGIRGELRRWCEVNDVRTQTRVIPTEGTLRIHVLAAKHWTPPRDLTR